MAEDAGGIGGFEVASAFVRVDPDASTFEESLEGQIGGLDYVVKIPVVPDTGDFAGELDAAVGESQVAVQVPVVPDTEGFQLLIDNAVAEAKASVEIPVVPDAAGFADEVDAAVAGSEKSVEVPVVPDMAGFAEEADTEAAAAGEAAGTTFAERIAAAAEASGLTAVWPELSAGAGPAGAAAGGIFSEEFIAATEPGLAAIMGARAAGLVTEAGTDGEEAGVAFLRGFSAADFAALKTPLAGLAEAADAESAVAGEEAGATFASRFSAALAGVGGTLDKALAGTEAEGAAAGAETGEGFLASMKTVLMGGMSPMEALIGAGFAAATVDMASHFQSAMELIHTQAGVAQSAISGLSGGVLALAGKVGESPDSLAQALYHVESSFQSVGISGQKAMSLLQVAAEGARTGNADLVDVTNALDATIASGVGGVKNYSQAMGALNAIVGAGDMTMQDLADAMGTGLMAAGKAYGQSIYEIGSALATFGDNNIRGAKAATDLRMAWQAVEAPLKTGIPVLNSLGLSANQLAQEMTTHGLTGALQMFVQHLEASKVPVSQWGQYVTEIFGKRAGVGLQVLMDQMDRLKSKFPDIEKGAHGFGSAWASTQATVSQKLKELESGFETLMIKIGAGLLPVVDKFLGDVNNALPGLEKFGGSLIHLVAPVVSAFFEGLGGIVREFVHFLSGNAPSLEKFGRELVKLAVPVVHTFFTNLFSVIKLLVGDIEGWLPHFEKLGELIAKLAVPAVGLFFTGLGGILKLLLGPLKDVTLAVGLFVGAWKLLDVVTEIDPFVAIGTAVVILAGLIIKYHKQILDVIEGTWRHITQFFTGDVEGFFTKTIPGWWDTVIKDLKSHLLKPLEDGFKDAWKWLVTNVWDPVQKFFTKTLPGWWDEAVGFLTTNFIDPIETGLQAAWQWVVNNVGAPIDTFFTKTLPGWWDDCITFLKTHLITPLENGLKTAWDWVVNNVGAPINTFFTKTLPGWWDTAITFLQTHFITPLENDLKTAWQWVMTNVWDPVDTFFTKTLPGWFDTARHDIAAIWDGILADITKIVHEIEQVVGGVLSLPGKVISGAGKLLGDIGLASGGVLPGYAPGHDSIAARLSPGEAVLVPEAVRAIGPDQINAINAHYSAGRRSGGGHYAGGGLVPGGLSPYAAGAAAGSAMQMSGYGQAGASTINNFYLSFSGARPTSEEWQAIQMKLSAAVGVA